MQTMDEIAQAAIDQTPPECRVYPEHAAILQKYQTELAALTPQLVDNFYNTLYDHEPTSDVFHDGERPMREDTLDNWWRRTLQGPIDNNYWSWMAMVGLLHVLRRVTNPMMMAMTQFVVHYVSDHIQEVTDDLQEQGEIVVALNRVAAMTASVITWGYDHAMTASLFEVAGMPEALLARLRDAEVENALVDARQEVGDQRAK